MIGLQNIDLGSVVFIDIETVRIKDKLSKEDGPLYSSWEYKLRYSRESEKFDESPLEKLFEEKAALYAEFAKIVCITIGKVRDEQLVLHSISNDDEAALLTEFSELLNNIVAKDPNTRLCGHAIKGFDIPFIMRRCIINGVDTPHLCDVAHLKPWETTMLDTLELWKGTGFYSASLINIAVAMGLPSPKDEMNGSDTSNAYYAGKLSEIVEYCERDVHTVCNVFLTMKKLKPINATKSKTKDSSVKPIEKLAAGMALTPKSKAQLLKQLDSLSDEERIIANEIIKATK